VVTVLLAEAGQQWFLLRLSHWYDGEKEALPFVIQPLVGLDENRAFAELVMFMLKRNRKERSNTVERNGQ
jgi:hypothetical protein